MTRFTYDATVIDEDGGKRRQMSGEERTLEAAMSRCETDLTEDKSMRVAVIVLTRIG